MVVDAGENRSHSLCTISVNVDCHDEFVVCYAMSRELNFPTYCLEVLGSQTVLIIWHLDSKSCALLPETAKSGFTDRRICSGLKKLKGCCCAKRQIRLASEFDQHLTYTCQNVVHIIFLGKQFRSVTQPCDERDTESRRSRDNLAS